MGSRIGRGSLFVFREYIQDCYNEDLGTQSEAEEGWGIVVIAHQEHEERPAEGTAPYQEEPGNVPLPLKVIPPLHHVAQ
jgi:hypothetical protein